MRTYHLLLADGDGPPARQIPFVAESPDFALVVAAQEQAGIRAELWDGARLLARLTKAAPDLWLLHPCSSGPSRTGEPAPGCGSDIFFSSASPVASIARDGLALRPVVRSNRPRGRRAALSRLL